MIINNFNKMEKEEKLDEKFNIGVEEIRNIKMTDFEKKQVLDNIFNSPAPLITPIKSPFMVLSFFSRLETNRFVYYGALPALAILIFSGAVFASTNSLPGSTLYSLKVGVVEPAHSALIFSPLGKANFQSSLATERLTEAEILESKNELGPLVEQKLNALLDQHTNAFNIAIDESRKNREIEQEEDDNLVTNFQATLNAHARVLDFIRGQKDKTATKEDNKISGAAREKADKVKSSIKSTAPRTGDKYSQKKEAVQSIIKQTTTDLEKHNSSDNSPEKETIINDTHQALDQAEQLLKEGDEQDEKGDSDGAYKNLLDSESSAKEAKIFLNTTLNLGGLK